MTDEVVRRYRHTLEGPWFLLRYGFGFLMLVVGWLVQEERVVGIVLPVAGAIMLRLEACFLRLTVADEEDLLVIRFGSLSLFQRRVRGEDIRAVEIGRTTLLDGWGIHLSLRGG